MRRRRAIRAKAGRHGETRIDGSKSLFLSPGGPMTTLSLAMIVKNEGATIERALNCAKLFADEMIVVDTGSTDDTVAKARAMGAKVRHFAWIDDFAAARNYSFSQCAMDWIIWLDGDDVISPENQKRILDLKRSVLNDGLQAIYLRYVYPPFQQWRERIARRDLFAQNKLQWKNPVHEFIDGVDGLKVKYFDSISILHDTPPDRHAQKTDRNISILRRHYANGATDDRSLFIYAVECLHSLLKDEGEQVLDRFFSQVRIAEYRYEIYSKMYDYYMHFGEPRRALEALSKAIVEDPSRAEAYYKLGRHLSDKADRPAAAIPLLTLAGMIRIPSCGTAEAEAYSYGPWEALCRAHFRLENVDAARQLAAQALERKPPDAKWLAELARWDEPFEPLPPQWREWTEGNLGNGVPRRTIIRILEENGYGPGQILEGLRAFDQKAAAGKTSS
jgi:glycosyltransferase involved in cell wall biosynthesis